LKYEDIARGEEIASVLAGTKCQICAPQFPTGTPSYETQKRLFSALRNKIAFF
jgi:hypothetical protein